MQPTQNAAIPSSTLKRDNPNQLTVRCCDCWASSYPPHPVLQSSNVVFLLYAYCVWNRTAWCSLWNTFPPVFPTVACPVCSSTMDVLACPLKEKGPLLLVIRSLLLLKYRDRRPENKETDKTNYSQHLLLLPLLGVSTDRPKFVYHTKKRQLLATLNGTHIADSSSEESFKMITQNQGNIVWITFFFKFCHIIPKAPRNMFQHFLGYG